MSTETKQTNMPSQRTHDAVTTRVLTIPNQLTAVRLVLAVVLFVLISLEMFLASLIVFVVAAATDWLDGYWARKYGQISVLGRIFDPFADKIIICGTFICLVPFAGSGIAAWMAVVVVGRELLVTAMRSHFEQQGIDFSANMAGKLKMVFQCIAAGLSLFYLHYQSQLPEEAATVLLVAVWAAIVLTLYSGIGYVGAAAKLIRR